MMRIICLVLGLLNGLLSYVGADDSIRYSLLCCDTVVFGSLL